MVELNRETRRVQSEELLTAMPSCPTWAVAQYWGDFWIFCGSRLTRFSLRDKKPELIDPDLGFNVVGAGVSTCAPSTKL